MIFDSNIVLHLLDEPPGSQLYLAIEGTRAGRVCINEIVFAELSSRFRSAELLERVLDTFELPVERLALAECHRAGLAYAEYRRRGGNKQTMLPDFLIGAQAELRGWPLVTRDRKGFASYFPDLKIIDPTEDLE